MTITNVNNNSYSSNDKPKKNKATLNAGLSWFAVDMAVSTAVDVYYNSKSKTQLTAKTLCKQVGTNALWAGISACIFAYPLAKIYEYTKGFIHAKTFIIDDEYATIGTVNLDYRSLYLHFECGVWLYDCSSIFTIKKDFAQTLKESKEITLKNMGKLNWFNNLKRQILKAFAPLM